MEQGIRSSHQPIVQEAPLGVDIVRIVADPQQPLVELGALVVAGLPRLRDGRLDISCAAERIPPMSVYLLAVRLRLRQHCQ